LDYKTLCLEKKIFIGLSLEILTLFRCILTIAMNQNVAAGIVVVDLNNNNMIYGNELFVNELGYRK